MQSSKWYGIDYLLQEIRQSVANVGDGEQCQQVHLQLWGYFWFLWTARGVGQVMIDLIIFSKTKFNFFTIDSTFTLIHDTS